MWNSEKPAHLVHTPRNGIEIGGMNIWIQLQNINAHYLSSRYWIINVLNDWIEEGLIWSVHTVRVTLAFTSIDNVIIVFMWNMYINQIFTHASTCYFALLTGNLMAKDFCGHWILVCNKVIKSPGGFIQALLLLVQKVYGLIVNKHF